LGISAEADVGTIVAAAMTPELAELERQLEETFQAMKVVDRELPAWRETTDRTLNAGRAIGRLNDDQLAAADARVDELHATKQALEKTAADIRAKISEVKPTFARAVTEGVAPIRTRAANDVQVAVNALYEAINRYNRTSEVLKQAGAVKRPLVFPVRIPTLDHFVQKMTEDRT
jgi:hypothetical protein